MEKNLQGRGGDGVNFFYRVILYTITTIMTTAVVLNITTSLFSIISEFVHVFLLHAQAYALLFLCSIHVTFIVLCCIVLALAIHSAYCIKRFSLLTAMMSNKLLGL